MRQKKKSYYGVWSILAIFILAGVFFLHPLKAEAAPFKAGGIAAEKLKVGKYYLWDAMDNTLRVSTSESGKGKVIARAPKGRNIGGYVSDGSTVYYPEIDVNTSLGYIYSVKINGKNRTYIGKVNKICMGILAYNNGNLYIGHNLSPSFNGSYDTYRLNIKTKKGKSVLKGAAPALFGTQYKHYIVFFGVPSHENSGGASDAYIFNSKTEKAVKISSKALRVNFSSGKVYYIEWIKNGSVKIMRCDLTGKNKKTLVKKLSVDFSAEITSKYVYYGKGDKYYRFDLKTKKSTRISKSKFQW